MTDPTTPDDDGVIHEPPIEDTPVDTPKPVDTDVIDPEDDASISDDEEFVLVPDEGDAKPVLAGEEPATFDQSAVELRVGQMGDATVYRDRLEDANRQDGHAVLDVNVRTVGSWENILFRMHIESSAEEVRTQNALGDFVKADETPGTPLLRNDAGKVILRTSPIVKQAPAGQIRRVKGEEALLAFACQETGGGFRIPLYNSGITIDVLVPTGNEIDTLLRNCAAADQELGASLGAHYFAYQDLMFKSQIVRFIQPLITGSSFADWRKKDKLWSIIKLPDLYSIMAHLSALCYPEGFDNFQVACLRPLSEKHPTLCKHVDIVKADIFKMIVTRFASLSTDAIDHMVTARQGATKHNAVQLAKYQANLGYEGTQITSGNLTFTMRVPSVAEHLEAGRTFMADIVNEVQGDNSGNQEEHVGLRHMRTFLPWIAEVTKMNSAGSGAVTDDSDAIVRELEIIDSRKDGGELRDKFTDFINRSQLTYVGYPNMPCPACEYQADTPSGMRTFDPFATFFMIAFMYTNPIESSTTPTV